MPHQLGMDLSDLTVLIEHLQFDPSHVALAGEAAIFIKHIGQATTHPGSEITSRLAEHNDQPARHVLASMVPHPFNYCDGAAVPYGKPLPCDAPEERFSAGRAIERDVADENIVLGLESGVSRRSQRH